MALTQGTFHIAFETHLAARALTKSCSSESRSAPFQKLFESRRAKAKARQKSCHEHLMDCREDKKIDGAHLSKSFTSMIIIRYLFDKYESLLSGYCGTDQLFQFYVRDRNKLRSGSLIEGKLIYRINPST